MDESVVVMEEGVAKIDSATSPGSLVQINSIAIDIRSSMEPPKVEHFSIRGFVAEMRKKNWKTCLPFGDGVVDTADNLPPLFVPSFRWWQCPSCVPDNEAQRPTEEKLVVETGTDHAVPDPCQSVGDEHAIILHSKENADASDMVAEPAEPTEPPLRTVDNPENEEQGNDDTVTAQPSKRKPKLRSLADIMGTENSSPTTEAEALLSPQPEVDVVPVDVAIDAVNRERKRKNIDFGDDGGPVKVMCRKSAAKRIKGRNVDAAKDSERVDVLDSGSDGGASIRSDLKLGSRIEPRKAKLLNNNKKMKQKLHEDRITAPVRKSVHVNGAHSAHSQKHGVPVEINFGKSGCSTSTMEETGPFFRSGEKICNFSKSTTPEVGADRHPVVLPKKSNFGDCSIRGKAALDLSLNSFLESANDRARHRGIPDLNEEPLEGNQLTALPDKSLPLHKTLDDFPPSRNGTTSEGKRQFRIPESENKEVGKELETSDDIPMEIVELLAKNQRERAIENSRYMLGMNNSTRGYPAMSVDGRHSMIDYPLNRSSGLTLRNGNMGLGQNTPHLNSYHRLDTSRTEDSLLWSSTRENAPFHHNIAPPKHSIQPNRCADSFLNRSLKGKTVTDMKDTSGISTSLGSLDPYSSNDTIPAMQLLSLMDQRVAVNSSFKVGAKSFLDKSFSPSISNHHPCLNDKKQSFHSGKLFSQNRHSGSKKASSSFRAQLVQNSKASDSALGNCTLNKNPAEFSVPDARNEFTLSAKDLKFRKRKNSKDKSRMLNTDGKKGRQRVLN